MAHAQRLHLRLFIEGVEVPVISANVQSMPNKPAMASIQIPAVDSAMDFKPRTLIHLFFLDFHDDPVVNVGAYVEGQGISRVNTVARDPELDSSMPSENNDATSAQLLTDVENRKYKLLFGGEVVGVTMQKTPSSRAIVLQCMDWSSYWDYSYQYQHMGLAGFGKGSIKAAFTGARGTVFDVFFDGTADHVTRLLDTPPKSWPQLKGTLLGGLVHIIEAIGGTYFGKRAVRGVNDFFSVAEMRLHLTQMVGANPFHQRDEMRLLKARGFGGIFRRNMKGLGTMISIRDVLMALQRYIFHEIVPITSPHYIPSPEDPGSVDSTAVYLEDDPNTKALDTAARRLLEFVTEIQFGQENTQTAAEGVELAQDFGTREKLRRYARIAGRAHQRARSLTRSHVSRNNSGENEIRPVFGAGAGVAEGFSQVEYKLGKVRNLLTQPTSLGGGAAFPAPNTRQSRELAQITGEMVETLNNILDTKHLVRNTRANKQPDVPSRLITQVWRPDVWMVAPPRSNVFFPENYNSFNYARSYLAETSRMMLRTHNVFFGSDFLFDNFYMAPSSILGQRRNRQILANGAALERGQVRDRPFHIVRDLLEHELYTGIIPKFERMSDLNLHAIRGGSTEVDGFRVGYAQLACNHIFFRQRFQTRQLSVTGKFNPWLVLGFPALIIDKYEKKTDSDLELEEETLQRVLAAQVEGEGLIDGLPQDQEDEAYEGALSRAADLTEELTAQRPLTHYLGTIGSITHNVSVDSGGNTAVNLGMGRTTNERTEFLGDNVVRRRNYRRTRNRTRTTVVAWLEDISIGMRGPYGGEITDVVDVTDEYKRRANVYTSRRRTATGQERVRVRGGRDSLVPLFAPGQSYSSRGRRATRVVVGESLPASSFGPEVTAIVGSAGSDQSAFISSPTGTTRQEIRVEFRAFRIREQVGVYENVPTTIPPEVLTFPPWYGNAWRSNEIGGIYGYLFGIGSIVDPIVVRGRTGERPDVPTADPEDEELVVDTANAQGEPAGEGPGGQPGEVVGPPGDPQVLGEIEARGTINNAADELVRIYSRVRREGLDVNEFIRNYTWRPVASAVDLLGTANLEINDEGEVVRGQEGFHSRAFGDFDDLRQLVVNQGDGQPIRILGLTTEDPEDVTGDRRRRAERDEAISARLDTRKEKRAKVYKYLQDLLASRGLLG